MTHITRRQIVAGMASAPAAVALGIPSTARTSAQDGSSITLSRQQVTRQPWMSGGQRDFYSLMFNTLATNSFEHDAIIPDLAESWEVSEDGTKFTFNLKQDVTWHDGEPFTSADITFSFARMLNPLTGVLGGFLTDIVGAQDVIDGNADAPEGIVASDDHTVTFNLSQPSATFVINLPSQWILPAHLLADIPPEDMNGSEYFETGYVGTGPFKFVEWVEDQYVELEAYENYFKGAPQIQQVIHRFIQQPEVGILALESEEVDFYQLIPSNEVERLSENPNIEMLGDTQSAFFFLMFNMTRPFFQDKRVRQAFGYAIDKKTVAETIYAGGATLVDGPLGWSDFWSTPDLPVYNYDPDRARQLLEEAGWDFDTNLEMLYNYTDQVNANVVTAFQQQWADVGLNVDVRLLEEEVYWELVRDEPNYDFVYDAGGTPDPDQLWIYFHSTAFAPESYNRSRYVNPEVDRLLEEGRQTMDQDARRPIYNEVERLLVEDAPNIFLWAPIRYAGVNSRLETFNWTIKGSAIRSYEASEETWSVSS